MNVQPFLPTPTTEVVPLPCFNDHKLQWFVHHQIGTIHKLEKVLFIFAAVGIPLAVFVFVQILRIFNGIARSGGADVMAIFLAVDLTVLFTPSSFQHVVVTPWLRETISQCAVVGVVIGGLVLTPFCVLYGERMLEEAEKAGFRYRFKPFVIIWGCSVWYVSAHALFFFGDWT